MLGVLLAAFLALSSPRADPGISRVDLVAELFGTPSARQAAVQLLLRAVGRPYGAEAPQPDGAGAEPVFDMENPDPAPAWSGFAWKEPDPDAAPDLLMSVLSGSDPGLACPVPGGSFANDWGAPRSGGRRHQGTDIFAPAGAPILSVTPGVVLRYDPVDTYSPEEGRTGDLGGITVTVLADSGERLYYAHMLAAAPDIGPGSAVEAGTVLGFVGSSGNARGTPPHLHLGWYYGETAYNPYPLLTAVCR